MTHTQTIPNLIVIDKEWLIDKIKGYDRVVDANTSSQFTEQLKAFRNELQSVINNSYPLSPIVEDAWGKGKLSQWNHYDENNKGKMIDKLEFDKQNYLSQQIKLVKWKRQTKQKEANCGMKFTTL